MLSYKVNLLFVAGRKKARKSILNSFLKQFKEIQAEGIELRDISG